MPSFSTSLSGLDSESQALSVISNNLANLNTVGYKAASPEFQDSVLPADRERRRRQSDSGGRGRDGGIDSGDVHAGKHRIDRRAD